ncbi:hypothetical protein AJ79_05385 [Helicocarpus griseus UAMH5409]|uniref:Uncharacterized protein n=1 Tax=Helicocarpus griseus UAMH5409 TaxID=1447875 RepID=A0A2B7XP34_9EURO|nr:hypothetical protein AJ79_05385 [Helicocarpus griseus UAMH5409]
MTSILLSSYYDDYQGNDYLGFSRKITDPAFGFGHFKTAPDPITTQSPSDPLSPYLLQGLASAVFNIREGDFISANHHRYDGRTSAPNGEKTKVSNCANQTTWSFEKSTRIRSGSGERPVKIKRLAKPKLVTIPRLPICRRDVYGDFAANDSSLAASEFEELSYDSEFLNAIPRGGYDSSAYDSGYVTQSPYGSTDDSTLSSLEDPVADASDEAVMSRLSLKIQSPQWSHQKSPLRETFPSFDGYSGNYSSPSSPLPKFTLLSPAKPTAEKRVLLAKCWSMGWILDHLETSISRSPKPDLTLSSPVIIFIRSTTEKALLDPFRDIFPSASIDQLSSLCAALVAQIYLSSVQMYEHASGSGNHNFATSGVDGVSNKARTRLGLNISETSQLWIKERLLRTRAADTNNRLNEIVDKLLIDLCGSTDCNLKGALMVLAQLLEGKRSPGAS